MLAVLLRRREDTAVGIDMVIDAAVALLQAFHDLELAAQGQLNGFRFRDFGPGEDLGYLEPLGVGTGGAVAYQRVKRYSIEGETLPVSPSPRQDRCIRRPAAGVLPAGRTASRPAWG